MAHVPQLRIQPMHDHVFDLGQDFCERERARPGGYAINDARDTLSYDRLAALVLLIGLTLTR